jgi:hypothetical protein
MKNLSLHLCLNRHLTNQIAQHHSIYQFLFQYLTYCHLYQSQMKIHSSTTKKKKIFYL